MKRVLSALLLASVCISAWALDDVAEDEALWKSVPRVEQKHELTPGGWHTVREERWGASFSAPCELQRSEVKDGAITAVQFQCVAGTRAFVAVVAPLGAPADKDGKAVVFQRFSMSNDRAMLRRMKEKGIEAKLIPRMWVLFGGLSGRQHTISTPNFDIETRTLQGPKSAVTMVVRDLHENFPGDVNTFFNTAKLE